MSGKRPIRIIVVDDDDVDRELVRRLIERSSISATIEELDCARPLLDRSDLSDVDCILLDYRLPDYDGLLLLRALCDTEGQNGPPIIVLTGQGNESLAVESIRGGAEDYLSKDGLTVDLLIRSIYAAIERKRLRTEVAQKTRELRRLSLYDELSGLPNRSLYLERLEQVVKRCRRTEESFALLVMDLVNFKEVNDSFGHPAGDRLIQVIGRRLARTCRDSDTIARIGGDEFAAILPATNDIDGAIIAAEKIEAAVSRQVLLDQGPVQVGISIGIALFPEHGADPEALYSNADSAMYQAKRLSKGYTVYRPENCAAVPPSSMLAGHLSEAIECDQLMVHYQPKIDMVSGELAGVEALVRWNHPTLGLLPPSEFVPRIERTSMIGPLTYTVLDKSLAQARKWRDTGRDVPVAVNLSARLLDSEELPERIDRSLKAHEVPPELLTLEITETGLMSNLDQATGILSRIKDRGVRISIDDFGTGYTSLRSLMSLPLSELKVDKLFIDGVCSNMMENAIVSSIVEISHGFNMKVVAEGVESPDTWKHLADIGCHSGQGFLVSEPVDSETIDGWVEDWISHARPAFLETVWH